jgi:peroxiredoxin
MKKIFFLLLPFFLSAQEPFFKQNPQEVPEVPHESLKIGSKAPDFKLPGVDGRYHTLAEYSKAKALVVVFTCNHCPTAQAYEDRLIQLTKDYKPKGVEVVAISPNSPIAVLLEEQGYTEYDDDFESMVLRAKDKNFNFPYLYDGDDHKVSAQFGPIVTPHAYVFDKNQVLQYNGRIDAVEKPGKANSEDLRNAIDAVLAGKTPVLQTTKVFGCSTKWAWKTEWTKKVNSDWIKKEVTIQDLDKAGIAELLANKTDKLLLVNVWASWCGPCILEYPEFIKMQRMYGERDFEFVSISADKPENKAKALNIMKKKQSAVRNFIFNSDDSYALIEAIDPKWEGALPYTLLIEPGGKVIFRAQSAIDPIKLRKMIVEHEKIGRYF